MTWKKNYTDHIDRVKRLRQILADIEIKCGSTCVHISTWFCNRECIIPSIRAIVESELLAMGEYVKGEEKNGP